MGFVASRSALMPRELQLEIWGAFVGLWRLSREIPVVERY